ncbi:hypothetical protein J6590_005641 [Homalodisca vitripennis]|nr:hypothetical protein J6590_005641 [Homalodisca vitripennis]
MDGNSLYSAESLSQAGDDLSICGGTSHFGSGTLGLFKPLAEKNIISNSVHLYQKLQEQGHNLGKMI